ncbi:MAG: hypothetical protein IJ667_04385 [Synergistaceae bacterium]|nr:hypothetical protein [Synergistaceae bacterium]
MAFSHADKEVFHWLDDIDRLVVGYGRRSLRVFPFSHRNALVDSDVFALLEKCFRQPVPIFLSCMGSFKQRSDLSSQLVLAYIRNCIAFCNYKPNRNIGSALDVAIVMLSYLLYGIGKNSIDLQSLYWPFYQILSRYEKQCSCGFPKILPDTAILFILQILLKTFFIPVISSLRETAWKVNQFDIHIQ